MGLSLFCPDEAAPVPRAVHLRLVCDGAGCSVSAVFVQADYVQQRAAASTAGWLERAVRDRVFLCPGCSGKKPAAI